MNLFEFWLSFIQFYSLKNSKIFGLESFLHSYILCNNIFIFVWFPCLNHASLIIFQVFMYTQTTRFYYCILMQQQELTHFPLTLRVTLQNLLEASKTARNFFESHVNAMNLLYMCVTEQRSKFFGASLQKWTRIYLHAIISGYTCMQV